MELQTFLFQNKGDKRLLYKNEIQRGEHLGKMLSLNDTDRCSYDDKTFMYELYLRYERVMLYTAFKYVQDKKTAEDILQTALERLIYKRNKLRKMEEPALNAYVVGTVRNVALNYLSREKVEMGLFDRDSADEKTEDIPDPLPGLDEHAISSERLEICRKGLESLPEAERRVLWAKYILELTDEEIAKEFGCKPSSIRMMLTRAKRLAREAFKKGGWIDKL